MIRKILPDIKNLRFMHGGEFKFNDFDIYITRSGYTGEDGFEVSIPNEIAENFTKVLEIEIGIEKWKLIDTEQQPYHFMLL